MSSGLLIAEALHEALRKPYHRGDMDVTMLYLVESLPIGPFRVMLKRNFDTACWIPPVGKRDSHSIYYGDRMVKRVVEFFCKTEKIELPSQLELAMRARTRIEEDGKRKSAKPTQTDLVDEQVVWLKETQPLDVWQALVERVVHAVKSYGRHERQHARLTPQDLKTVNKDLKSLGIPFMYFNLFEDARIEHVSRQEMGDPFDWLTLEDIAPPNQPFNMFLRCIQLEGAPDNEALDNETQFKPDDERTVGIVADSVESYYKRACECTQAEALYPIIQEFLLEFKEDLPPDEESGEGEGEGKGKGKGKGTPGSGTPGSGKPEEGEPGEGDDGEEQNGAEERAGDLSTAADAAEEGDKFFEDFESDTEVVGGTDAAGKDADEKAKAKAKGDGTSPPPKGKGGKGQGIPDSIVPSGASSKATERDFLAVRAGAIDDSYRKRVDDLTSMLMRMFKVHNLPAYTEAEGRRMSGRHLARGEIRFVHKKVFGGKGKRKYSIVYDCSGSMNGKPDREGKVLLLALNNLARRGFLEGNLILSGYVNGSGGWLQYKFPVKDEIILRIATNHGSEGLQPALRDNLAKIKGMDDVFVYTDANICDSPINRAMFASNRIWPVGLYVGGKDQATEMERHFPQNIIRDSIESLVETMLTRNRRSVN